MSTYENWEGEATRERKGSKQEAPKIKRNKTQYLFDTCYILGTMVNDFMQDYLTQYYQSERMEIIICIFKGDSRLIQRG